MTEPLNPFHFNAMMSGFDFFKTLSQSTFNANMGNAQAPSSASPQAAQPLSALAHWMTPTFNVEELDKRIQDLKVVQFWLEQNNRALTATIQTLEVQKMTLTTLKSMNVGLNDLMKAFPFQMPQTAQNAPSPTSNGNQTEGNSNLGASSSAASRAFDGFNPENQTHHLENETSTTQQTKANPLGVDPIQWWSLLTQQFQSIADNTSNVWQEAARNHFAASTTEDNLNSHTNTNPVNTSANTHLDANDADQNKSFASKTLCEEPNESDDNSSDDAHVASPHISKTTRKSSSKSRPT